MAYRSDVWIDFTVSPRMVWVSAPATDIILQDLVDTVRTIESEQFNLTYPHILTAAGKDALGGGVLVGITVTLNNAQLAFEARPGPTFVQCNVTGGNLVATNSLGVNISPIATTAYTQVVRTSSSSATLQELTELRYSSYEGYVHINATTANAGTVYPLGTPRFPVNNLLDADLIADAVGISSFKISGNLSLNSGTISLAGYRFVGNGPVNSTITIMPAAIVDNSTFENSTFTGTLDANATVHEAIIDNLTYINGVIRDCLLVNTLSLAITQPAYFVNCAEGDPLKSPILDMTACNASVVFRNYVGAITIRNKTNANTLEIDLESGDVIIDATCTTGPIIVRGSGRVINNSVIAVDTADLIQGTAATVAAIRTNLTPELTHIMSLQNGLTAAQALVLQEIYTLYGLDMTKPLVVTDTSRTAGTIVQGINSNTTQTTVTRTA